MNVGSGPQAVSIDSSGQFLYVGHSVSNEVWEYSIDGASGALTFLRKIRSGKGVDGMAISSGSSAPVYTDSLAFDVNSAGVGATFVDGSSGALGTPFSMNPPASPLLVAVDPYGRFFYAAETGSNTVAQYSLGAFGSITFNGTIATGNSPFPLTVDPSGRFLYVSARNGIFGFTINQSSGLLTAIAGGAALGVGLPLGQIITDPMGRFLFFGDNCCGSDHIYVYSINPASGVLSAVTGSPFTTTVADNIVADPSGRFLYVAGGTGTGVILACPISAANGAISCSTTQLKTTSFNGIAVEPYGRYAYASAGGTSGTVVAYSIDQTNGNLSTVGSPVAAGNNPGSIAVDTQGQYVYVANYLSNTISAYSINPSTGAITEITGAGSPFAAGTNPGSVVISGYIQ